MMKCTTIMIQKLTTLLISLIILVSCSGRIIGSNEGAATVAANPPIITDPITARNFILEYLNRKYGLATPGSDAAWEQSDLLGAEQENSTAYQYVSDSITVVITYPNVAAENTIFTLTISRDNPGFSWNGLLDAYGRITEVSYVEASPTPTLTPSPQPSETPTPTPTLTPIPTETPTPSLTPAPTHTQTSTPDPCNWASFAGDITIPDGTNFAPGTDFVKIWKIKNIGSCTWTTDYDLIFVKGDLMDARMVNPFPGEVRPGESIDLAIDLRAPQNVGEYRSFWMLRAPGGEQFGLGFGANQTFWVSISVLETIGGFRYDFGLNWCSAIWRSAEGRRSCAETTDDPDGYVRVLEDPKLESGVEDQTAIWLHPNEVQYGWIDGTYPYFKVKDGDHFQARVGCLEGYGHCSVSFYLDIEDEDGRIIHLGRWRELYDGEISNIDIDLSNLAGRSLRFILGMEADTQAVEDAQGFWLLPRIED
jgi:hypothetical protein